LEAGSLKPVNLIQAANQVITYDKTNSRLKLLSGAFDFGLPTSSPTKQEPTKLDRKEPYHANENSCSVYKRKAD
jgi:hypothetical protein